MNEKLKKLIEDWYEKHVKSCKNSLKQEGLSYSILDNPMIKKSFVEGFLGGYIEGAFMEFKK